MAQRSAHQWETPRLNEYQNREKNGDDVSPSLSVDWYIYIFRYCIGLLILLSHFCFLAHQAF